MIDMEFTCLLNLGCGHVNPDGWINVDGSNRAWLASKLPLVNRLLTFLRILPSTDFSRTTTYADLTKRFPWNDGSIDGIYMGEILEHFTMEDGEHVLRECHRVLKKNGVVRIRVPDNFQFWKNYLDEYTAMKQRSRSEWSQDLSRWVKMFFRDICIRKPRLFHSMGHYHKWMYDEISITLLLERIGFLDVNRMEFHKSRLPGIERVEARDDLIVEAVR